MRFLCLFDLGWVAKRRLKTYVDLHANLISTKVGASVLASPFGQYVSTAA